jgi:predicted nucleic acid-binding protein
MILIDSNIPMYAAGKEHAFKQPCIDLLMRVANGELEVVIDAEVLQEILYRFWYLQKIAMGFQIIESLTTIIPTVLPVTKKDIEIAKDILQAFPTISPRDAIHAAIMRNHSIKEIYSYDQDFNLLPQIKRIEP